MKLQRYTFTFFIVVYLVIIFITDKAFAFRFNIEPARVELQIKADKSKNSVITIDNTQSKEPLHVKAYIQDVAYLPDGTNEFLPKGSTSWSAANWITISPKEIDVPAGSYAKVKLNIKVPKGATGGYYAVVFFETGPALQPGQTGIGVNIRAGALILVTIPRTESYKAKITDLRVEEDEGAYKADIIISNQSNVLIRPLGKIKILNEKGKKIKTQDMNEGLVGLLPMTSRKFTVELVELDSGEYSLQAVVDYGGKDLLVGEIPFKIGQ